MVRCLTFSNATLILISLGIGIKNAGKKKVLERTSGMKKRKSEKVKWRDKSETNQSKNISYGYKKCRQIDPRVSLLQTFSETGSVLKVITKGICFQSFPPLL